MFKVFQNPELDIEFELDTDNPDTTSYVWIIDEKGSTIHLTKQQINWIAYTFIRYLEF